MNNRCSLVYDTDTAVLGVGTHAPPRMVFGFGICMPVGEVLYLLSYRLSENDGPQSFEAMSSSSPTRCTRTGAPSIFMTTAYKDIRGAPVGTYSFNTRESTWRWHGQCALPFHGQAHFDAELGAWVGLDLADGHTTKEKMLGNDGCTIRASLTYMGTRRFCLVECVPSKVTNGLIFRDKDGCVLHVTIFGVKYNHKGELQTTNQRSTRSFVVSRHRCYFGPLAFWA
ncbi:hypothetical protein BDA96_07G008100 [Sorghum bicolor]|uniref:Uncharacterized protein n=1 Tax=Sorghum bicolor TaxID=4558 RepID=A0A921U8D4_SORBI|nr:hypothetical protein BDA96_07G008100 [Sorghum bicolor]